MLRVDCKEAGRKTGPRQMAAGDGFHKPILEFEETSKSKTLCFWLQNPAYGSSFFLNNHSNSVAAVGFFKGFIKSKYAQ